MILWFYLDWNCILLSVALIDLVILGFVIPSIKKKKLFDLFHITFDCMEDKALHFLRHAA